ncbi:hypothetical protein [Nocardioides campestrisoli]|uniref:hypothetical protein n=1 Tax=Nocardioides campestrisoli TaxID=2736757 RepID=UPI00163D4938|nr:hypothetical protein [Nocardioides campestrisoli]
MSPRASLAARTASGLLLVVALAVGCGGSPRTSPPSGVDGLVIPTPSPAPDDFVTGIDNPWLPLAPGATWTFEVQDATGEAVRTTRVLSGTREVAGIAATQVETRTETDGAGTAEATELRWYAQDRAGNVWALGEQGVWEAGVDGAEAGLAMPAAPRRGDAFALWWDDGTPGTVVRVGERDSSVTVPAGRFTELLEIELTGGPPEDERTVYLAREVGEVLSLEQDGASRVELVEHRAGA